MYKVDKENFMSSIWKKYNSTKDIELLAKACEAAPFFGQKEMAFEIARILRLVSNNKSLINPLEDQFKRGKIN